MPSFLLTPLKILLTGLAAVAVLLVARLAGLGLGPIQAAPASLAAVLVFLVGIGFAAFLWWLAARCFTLLRDPATTPEQMAALRELPLALPEGTVRALLALIVGVIGLPLLLFSQSLALNDAIAGYVNGIIAGVFGYYFGARSTNPEAQAARRLSEALESQTRAHEALRQSTAPEAREPAEALARLERHLGTARLLVQRIGPALPSGLIPREAEAALAQAEAALAQARTRPDLAAIQAAIAALTGASGPLPALLRAAAPLLPAAAGGPLGGGALLLGLGWSLGAAAWRRFRARLLEAPHDPTLFEPGAITPASAALRLAEAPIFARLFTPRLSEPGFLPALLDTCLRPEAAALLWARYPGFAGPEEAAAGLSQFRRALLEDRVEADLSPDLVARVAQGLGQGGGQGLGQRGGSLALPGEGPEAARAALQALTLLLGEWRESRTDPTPLLRELAA